MFRFRKVSVVVSVVLLTCSLNSDLLDGNRVLTVGFPSSVQVDQNYEVKAGRSYCQYFGYKILRTPCNVIETVIVNLHNYQVAVQCGKKYFLYARNLLCFIEKLLKFTYVTIHI